MRAPPGQGSLQFDPNRMKTLVAYARWAPSESPAGLPKPLGRPAATAAFRSAASSIRREGDFDCLFHPLLPWSHGRRSFRVHRQGVRHRVVDHIEGHLADPLDLE
jgi:hypothetical protein